MTRARSGARLWRWLALTLGALALALAGTARFARASHGPSGPRSSRGAQAAPPNEREGAAPRPAPTVLEREESGNDETQSLLLALSRSDDPKLRSALIGALGADGDEAALEPLNQLANDPLLASSAFEAIGRIGGARARALLLARVSQAEDDELQPILAGLAALGGRDGFEALRAASNSSRPGLASAALSALATLDMPEVRELMLRNLGLTDAGEIAVGYFVDAVDARALPALERLIRSADVATHGDALNALLNQGGQGQLALERLLHGDPQLSDAVLNVGQNEPALRPILRAAAIARLRAGAITGGPLFEYLASDLSSEAREALVRAARDGGSSASAISALAQRADAASRQALWRLSRDSDPKLAALAGCSLFEAVDSRSRATFPSVSTPDLRLASVAALLSINAPESSAALRALHLDAELSQDAELERLEERYGAGSEPHAYDDRVYPKAAHLYRTAASL